MRWESMGVKLKAFTWICEQERQHHALFFFCFVFFVLTDTKTHLVFWPLPPLSLAVWQVQSWSPEAWQWILTGETCALCPSPELHRPCVRSLAWARASPGLSFALCYRFRPPDPRGPPWDYTYAHGQCPPSPLGVWREGSRNHLHGGKIEGKDKEGEEEWTKWIELQGSVTVLLVSLIEDNRCAALYTEVKQWWKEAGLYICL